MYGKGRQETLISIFRRLRPSRPASTSETLRRDSSKGDTSIGYHSRRESRAEIPRCLMGRYTHSPHGSCLHSQTRDYMFREAGFCRNVRYQPALTQTVLRFGGIFVCRFPGTLARPRSLSLPLCLSISVPIPRRFLPSPFTKL